MDPHVSGSVRKEPVSASYPLHPEDAAKVFVHFFGPLALAAASEEAFSAWCAMSAKYELILLSSAEGAGFPMKFAAHRSDSSDLFMHRASIEKGELAAPIYRRVGVPYDAARACSTIPSKWDMENTV